MEQEIKFAGMDHDNDQHNLQPGSYLQALNIRINGDEDGSETGVVEDAEGNHPIDFSHLLPQGENKTVGYYEDKERGVGIMFNYNSQGEHGIYWFELVFPVQASGVLVWEKLNFTPETEITGIGIIGDILFWADGGRPKRVNMPRAQNNEVWPILTQDPDCVNLARRPPAMPPFLSRVTVQPAQSNAIEVVSAQARCRFIYEDHERSVWGPASAVSHMHPIVQGMPSYHNALAIAVHPEENISKQVVHIEYALRTGDMETWKIAGRTTRDGQGVLQRSLTVNNTNGDGIDPAEEAKPYDAVPPACNTLAVADNRVFIADSTEGYDPPRGVSLVVTPDTAQAEIVTRSLFHVTAASSAADPDLLGYYISHHDGYLKVTWGGAGTVAKLNLEKLIYRNAAEITNGSGSSPAYAYQMALVGSNTVVKYYNEANYSEYATTFEGPHMKMGGLYKVGIVFYDQYLQNCGVVEHSEMVKIPESHIEPEGYWSRLNWQIPTSVANETIPEWAHFYQIVRTIDLRYSFFLNDRAHAVFYEQKYDPSDPALAQTDGYELGIHYAADRRIHVNIKLLLKRRNIGYVYAPGDRMRISFTDWVADLEIKGQHGDWLILASRDLATFNPGFAPNIEIYRPYMPATTEPYFETGACHRVINPETPNRLYSVRSGSMGGDCFILKREVLSDDIQNVQISDVKLYDVKLESVNNQIEITTNTSGTNHANMFFNRMDILISMSGFQYCNLQTYSINSGQYVPTAQYTTVAQMQASTVEAVQYFLANYGYMLNTRPAGYPIAVEAMSPRDQVYANWVRNTGRINVSSRDFSSAVKRSHLRFSNTYVAGTKLNGLSEFEPLNETQLPIEQGAIRKMVGIGRNLLVLQERGSRTILLGQTQLTDSVGQTLIAESTKVVGTQNPHRAGFGTRHPASVQEMDGQVFWWDDINQKVARYAGDGVSPVSDILLTNWFNLFHSDGQVRSAKDPLHNEYILTLGANTISFHTKRNRWRSFWSYVPDWGGSIGRTLITFKNGLPWVHDSFAEPHNYYGEKYSAWIDLVCNAGGTLEKLFLTTRQKASHTWTVPMIQTPEGQYSNLIEEDFEASDGWRHAAFLMDAGTPNIENPLIEGDQLRSSLLRLRLQRDAGVPTRATLTQVNVQFVPA